MVRQPGGHSPLKRRMIRPEKLDPANKPKRLLSIDGGGLRGTIGAEILVHLEEQLEQRTGVAGLANHFELIGGTSTGAFLAAGLALGIPARALLAFFVERVPTLLRKAGLLQRFRHRYQGRPLARELQNALGAGTTLASDRLRTLLLIVVKNATTGSPWFFTNNPQNPYCMLFSSVPLWQLVRASTAAPTYFPPERITIADRHGASHTYEFIDGGVSTFDNPSFQLFLEATEPQYRLGWQSGPNNLLLLSVGNGLAVNRLPLGAAAKKSLLGWARYLIADLIEDTNLEQDVVMKLISEAPHPGRREPDGGPAIPAMPTLRRFTDIIGLGRLLTYQRYTVILSPERLTELGLGDIDPEKISRLDAIDQIPNLQRIGRKIAERQVRLDDLAAFFPPKGGAGPIGHP
jgi:Patatin-like phospholipase